MTDRVYIGPNVENLEKGGELPPISRVTLFWGEEDTQFFTAGDDTGRELTAFCPSATQAMANDLLASLGGCVYRPYAAESALLDPAAEVGDAVTLSGLYSVLAQTDVTFDAATAADISAPGEAEIDHEYPYMSPENRELKRKVSLGTSYYGTKITRKDGLTIERITDGNAEAKAVLNADELSFYAGSKKVLFFDPATGTYRFDGSMNVSDNFVVDKSGNVSMKGNINLSNGKITWGGNYPGTSLPSYIKSTYIDSTTVMSPTIQGGTIIGAEVMSTGKNADQEIDLRDGQITFGSNGILYYDADTSKLNLEAYFVPLKIKSGKGISIDAGASDYVHVGSSLHAWGGIVLDTNSYGYSLPAGKTVGQLFFKLGE